MHLSAVLEHDHAVAFGEHLAHMVRDEQDAEPALLEVAQEGEEEARLGQRQRRRRLVEDQHARAARQRLEDVEDLQLAEVEPVAFARQVEAHAEPVGERARLCEQRPLVDQPHPARLAAEHDVLGGTQRPDHRDLLVGHRDAGGERVGDAAHLHRLPAHLDRAAVGLVGAADQLDEGRLAGAVRTHQRQHLARAQVEIHAGQSKRAGKALARIAHPEHHRPGFGRRDRRRRGGQVDDPARHAVHPFMPATARSR